LARAAVKSRRGEIEAARAVFRTVLELRPGDAVASAALAAPNKVPAPAPIGCAGLGKRVALVVANGAYVGAAALANPVNDADDFTRTLRERLCFSVIEAKNARRYSALGRGMKDSRGLAPMTTRSSESLVVFATRPNARAADGDGRNSPFTSAFLRHVVEPNRDIELVMRDVSARVDAATGGRQAPQAPDPIEAWVDAPAWEVKALPARATAAISTSPSISTAYR
jgi:hypothetical protein